MWSEIVTILESWWAIAPLRAGLIIAGTILGAYMIEFGIRRGLTALTHRTQTQLDDHIVAVMRRPIFLSVILIGLAWALSVAIGPGMPRFVAYGILRTVAVLIWTSAAFQICTALLSTMSSQGEGGSLLQPRTFPLFDIIIKVVVIGGAVYFTFLSWNIDVTAWLASAGIVGIAVGFAAKDSLANLIAGIFILADAPYQVGDWLVLDGELRGKVRRIGIRSTRILTRDDVEITIPNSVMGNAKIINEAGGPHIKQRVAALVSVSYEEDVDHVAKVLLSCVDDIDHVCDTPSPDYLFTGFGASGLDFTLFVWTERADMRDHIVSELNMRIFKRFRAENIEIPYSKHDVYIKEAPQSPRPGDRAESARHTEPAPTAVEAGRIATKPNQPGLKRKLA